METEKSSRRELRGLDIGAVDIRRRGLAGDVDQLHRDLKLSGSRRATLVMTRVEGGRGDWSASTSANPTISLVYPCLTSAGILIAGSLVRTGRWSGCPGKGAWAHARPGRGGRARPPRTMLEEQLDEMVGPGKEAGDKLPKFIDCLLRFMPVTRLPPLRYDSGEFVAYSKARLDAEAVEQGRDRQQDHPIGPQAGRGLPGEDQCGLSGWAPPFGS